MPALPVHLSLKCVCVLQTCSCRTASMAMLPMPKLSIRYGCGLCWMTVFEKNTAPDANAAPRCLHLDCFVQADGLTKACWTSFTWAVWSICTARSLDNFPHLCLKLFSFQRQCMLPSSGVRFVPPVSGSEVTCELEFTVPADDRFFDDKVSACSGTGCFL